MAAHSHNAVATSKEWDWGARPYVPFMKTRCKPMSEGAVKGPQAPKVHGPWRAAIQLGGGRSPVDAAVFRLYEKWSAWTPCSWADSWARRQRGRQGVACQCTREESR